MDPSGLLIFHKDLCFISGMLRIVTVAFDNFIGNFTPYLNEANSLITLAKIH